MEPNFIRQLFVFYGTDGPRFKHRIRFSTESEQSSPHWKVGPYAMRELITDNIRQLLDPAESGMAR